jgi:hypothetical protein
MNMEQQGDDTERGKTEVLGEKHYTVWGGRWVNEYGAMVERY